MIVLHAWNYYSCEVNASMFHAFAFELFIVYLLFRALIIASLDLAVFVVFLFAKLIFCNMEMGFATSSERPLLTCTSTFLHGIHWYTTASWILKSWNENDLHVYIGNMVCRCPGLYHHLTMSDRKSYKTQIFGHKTYLWLLFLTSVSSQRYTMS